MVAMVTIAYIVALQVLALPALRVIQMGVTKGKYCESMRTAQVLDQPAKPPKKFDLEKYIRQGAFGFEESGEIKLVVRFTTPAVEHLRETPLSLDQQIEPEQADWARVQATVMDTAQLRWWLMGFGDQVEVLEPASLRDAFVNMSQSLHGIYHPAK